jgi:hypothetical protein
MDIETSPFFPDSKLLKSIDIDPAGGRAGGSPWSFLQLVINDRLIIVTRNKIVYFFIDLEFSLFVNIQRQSYWKSITLFEKNLESYSEQFHKFIVQ